MTVVYITENYALDTDDLYDVFVEVINEVDSADMSDIYHGNILSIVRKMFNAEVIGYDLITHREN